MATEEVEKINDAQKQEEFNPRPYQVYFNNL